jgi:autotransporter-associated beta strand protein
VLGDISGGVGGTNTMTINPGAGNSFGYAGAISNFANVQVTSGTVTLTGVSTYTGTTTLSGGTLVLDGANRLASGSALDLAGGTLELLHSGGANGQTFASLALTANSTIDLNGSSLTFGGLGSIVAGKTLTIDGYLASASPNYALRLLGDYTGNAAFETLLADMTIDGFASAFSFDGTYTDVFEVAAVPEPSNIAMLLAGLGLVGVIVRRRSRATAA